MKYQALYDYTIANGHAIVRVKDYPEKIVMPAVGFVVGGAGAWVYALADDTEAFDNNVERILLSAHRMGHEFMFTSHHDDKIIVEVANVYSPRNFEFAKGVAFGRQEAAVYDIAAKKGIVLR